MTVLWATHLTDEVADSDQVILLLRGRVLADGSCGELRGDAPLHSYFAQMTGASA